MIQSKPWLTNKLSTSKNIWLVIVLGVSILERALVIFFYQPVTYSDTPSYRRLADSVLQGFSNYDGTRTPGYPVFMALVGTDQRVWFAQLCLGVIATLLLFYIGWRLTDKPWFGGLVALAHSLNMGQLFFESNLLTESLTTFLLVLLMAGVLLWLLNPKSHSLWFAFLLGLVSVIVLLVRPLFIYLPFVLLVFLWLEPRLNKHAEGRAQGSEGNISAEPARHPVRYGIAFLVPVVLLLGGWITFIHEQFDQWSLTTMTGYHLVQHTGNYFEYVPDEYASLRDTYIRYRDAHIAQFGTQTNAIWDAIPEMIRVSGYGFYNLSRVLTRISIQLIEQHPILFIKSAISGWWMFWRAPVYWSPDAVKLPSLTAGITDVIQIQRALLILVNILFILASIYFAVIESISAIRRRQYPQSLRFSHSAQYAFMWFLPGIIWIASILQTLLDHGDNPRFLVPLQSLVVLWVAIFIHQLVISRQVNRQVTAQAK